MYVIETKDITLYIHRVLIFKINILCTFPLIIHILRYHFSGLVICLDIDLLSFIFSDSAVQMSILNDNTKLLNCSSWHYK